MKGDIESLQHLVDSKQQRGDVTSIDAQNVTFDLGNVIILPLLPSPLLLLLLPLLLPPPPLLLLLLLILLLSLISSLLF